MLYLRFLCASTGIHRYFLPRFSHTLFFDKLNGSFRVTDCQHGHIFQIGYGINNFIVLDQW